MTELERSIATAVAEGKPLPRLPENLSLDEAYQRQHLVTEFRSPGGIAGIKAGVTAKNVQAFLEIDEALIASLYEGTKLNSGVSLPFVEGRLIETEVALRIDASGHLLSIAPALEIVAVRFQDPSEMNAANLVMCNLGADLFVVGEFKPWDPAFDDLAVTLVKDGGLMNETNVNDALGGPGAGAKWVLNEANKRGFTVGDDTVFMMGACGKAMAVEPGHYFGDYGVLGNIELTVEEKD